MEEDYKSWVRKRKGERRLARPPVSAWRVERHRLSRADRLKIFDGETVAGKRKYHQKMKERTRKARVWFRDLNEKAQPRKEYVEQVAISVVILPDLAKQVDLPKLASAKRVLLTMQVEGFTIRAPPAEIEKPHAIGSLSGIMTNVAKNMLRKN